MPKPTQSQAHAIHTRVDAPNKALARPGEGGPMYQDYTTVLENDNAYRADHPRYPDYVYPDDQEADTQWAAKDQLVEGTGARYTYQLGPSDVRYLLNKKEAQEAVRFKQFVEDSIPRGTPWAKEFFEKIMPGWYQSKIDVVNEKLNIVQKLIEITIHGPQSIDDMSLLYQVYSGRIEIPQNFEQLIRPASQGLSIGQFRSGLFNPKRYVAPELFVSKRNQEYMANFAIPGIDPKGVGDNGIARSWNQSNNTGNAVFPFPNVPYQPYAGDGKPHDPGFPGAFFKTGTGQVLNPAATSMVNQAQADARVRWRANQPANFVDPPDVPANYNAHGTSDADRERHVGGINYGALNAATQRNAGPEHITFDPNEGNIRGIRSMRRERKF